MRSSFLWAALTIALIFENVSGAHASAHKNTSAHFALLKKYARSLCALSLWLHHFLISIFAHFYTLLSVKYVIWGLNTQTFSERRSYERRSERRSQLVSTRWAPLIFQIMSAKRAPLIFYCKSAWWALKFQKSAKRARKTNFQKKLNKALIKTHNFPYINSFEALNTYLSVKRI